MTTKRKSATGKAAKQLKLRRESIKDLDLKNKAKGVKGGWFPTADTSKYAQSCRSCAACLVATGAC